MQRLAQVAKSSGGRAIRTIPLLFKCACTAMDMTSGTFITSFIASLQRTDLPFPDQDHGFDQVLATNPLLADGKIHAILAFGVTATGAVGARPDSGRTIQCTAP